MKSTRQTAQEFVDYALRHADHINRLVLDLSGVEFFGTAGFSAMHTLNVRCAGESIEWASVPSAAVIRLLRVCDPDSTLPFFDGVDGRWPRSRASRVAYCSWSRSRVRDFASSRDTCICEMPTRSAICV